MNADPTVAYHDQSCTMYICSKKGSNLGRPLWSFRKGKKLKAFMRLRALWIVGGLSESLNVNLCVFDPVFLKGKVLFYFSILVIKKPRFGPGIIKNKIK
jgi:hypothetical protein